MELTRRGFIKAAGLLLSAPLAGFAFADETSVPSRYRGFDVNLDTLCKPHFGVVRQIYVTNGKYHTSAIFEETKNDAQIWKVFKPSLDKAIDRYIKRMSLYGIDS